MTSVKTIDQIIRLGDVIFAIQTDKALWFVATQTHPEFWTNPNKALQWYIDANWLIKTEHGLLYDPRLN
jgi:CTP synthase (UTP-ammonia lyase)